MWIASELAKLGEAEAICFNSVWVLWEADAHGHPDPWFLSLSIAYSLLMGTRRQEELNTQVQTEPALNFSDLFQAH